MTAVYSGDSIWTSSTSNELFQEVDAATTTTSLTSSLNLSQYGQAVTFTAYVTPSYSGTSPTGTVTFYDGCTALDTETLTNSGQVSYTTSALAEGDQEIRAVYSGDSLWTGSTSPVLTEVVNLAAPTVWTVDLASDTGAQDPNKQFAGDLLYCLTNAKNGDTIDFDIGGGGAATIVMNAPLNVTTSVTIDATSQPGYNGQQPLIALDGGTNQVQGNALNITAPGVTVEGLSITNFSGGAAVRLTNPKGGCTVSACYLGLLPSGTIAANSKGVWIANSAGNTITNDVISGNTDGIWIIGDKSKGNTVTSCYIGTDPQGQVAKPNTRNGVLIAGGASANTIGGDYFTQGNVISGNLGDGIRISGGTGNIVEGNRIGVSATGLVQLANGGDGVHVMEDANKTIIGGSSGFDENGNWVDYGNVISGNTLNGISVGRMLLTDSPTGTRILDNYIGLASNGTTALGNGKDGILIENSLNTVIGDGAATDGNVISGNGSNGIEMQMAPGVQIYGNYIGTDRTGLVSKPNQYCGILIGGSTTFTQVGQAGASFRNVISGNTEYGIDIYGTNNTVANNYIGLGSDGQTNVGNQQGGIVVENNATLNTIGGTNYNLGNVISGNQGNAGTTLGNGIALLTGSSQTTIAANLVGTNAAGTLGVANSNNGIYVQVNSRKNVIGLFAAYNIVSGNGQYGIDVDGTNNTINFNMAGLDFNFNPLASRSCLSPYN